MTNYEIDELLDYVELAEEMYWEMLYEQAAEFVNEHAGILS